MKKIAGIFIVLFTLIITSFTIYGADFYIKLDKIADTYTYSDSINITGSTNLQDGKVLMKITLPNSNILTNDTEIVNSSFSFKMDVATSAEIGTYKVIVNSLDGKVYDSLSFRIISSRNDDNGGGGGGGGATAPTPEVKPGEIIVPTTTYNSLTGDASTKLTSDAIKKAEKTAVADKNGIKTLTAIIPKNSSAKSYSAELIAADLKKNSLTSNISIQTVVANVTIPNTMLSQSDIDDPSSVYIRVAKAEESKLSEDLKAKIGNRPVVDISLIVNGKTVSWDNPDAPITISLDYTPTADELLDPEHIVVWYLDGKGNAVAVPSGRYDPATKKVTFKTTHLSEYAVAFVRKTFVDVTSGNWAKNYIEIMASKGIIAGTSETTFSPYNNISRADFIILLVKTLALNAPVDNNFSDVSQSDYYYKCVGIAKKLGIVSGVGDDKFLPKEQISRQDMMVMVSKALKVAKKDLQSGTASDIKDYSDSSIVASYAVDSVATLVKNGVITGNSSKINPLGNATRAEIASIIYKIYNKYMLN